MADFDPAFERMIANEGGYHLHEVAGDRGGMTYAGIARNMHPDWAGWSLIDAGAQEEIEGLVELVKAFYREQFWNPIRGSSVVNQMVAASIFDFAVNAGARTAIKLAQQVVGVTADGIIGPVSLRALNEMDPVVFVERYALAKIARYAEICNGNRSQSKFLLGWINRALKELTPS